MQQDPSRVFSENWNVYQKLVNNNYMHHAEFSVCIKNVFSQLDKNKRLNILDIGCGDAKQMAEQLEHENVNLYKGYDLSVPALELAAKNLSLVKGSVNLLTGNMKCLINAEQDVFDIISSSFAIHHLQDEEKKELLKKCFERLNAGGKMIYTDVFKKNTQNRDEYINDYLDNIHTAWTALTSNEKQLISDHISQYDFPSVLEDTAAWLRSAGFMVMKIYQPDKLHAMLVLSKE